MATPFICFPDVCWPRNIRKKEEGLTTVNWRRMTVRMNGGGVAKKI